MVSAIMRSQILDCSDPRLNDVSELTRGCGGVAILWKKGLTVERLSCNDNGRICVIKVQLENGYTYPKDYQSCLQDLEEVLSSLSPSQPAMVVGDFNAHLADGRGTEANAQGVALGNFINKYSLYVASLDKETSGPRYTYCSGEVRTTVDYMLVNLSGSYLITSSAVLEDHLLNTSDHLPLQTSLEVRPTQTQGVASMSPKVDWSKVGNGSCIVQYQTAINGLVRPLIGNNYESIAQVEQELNLVSTGILNSAFQLLPLHKKHIPRRRFKDAELQRLCDESKQTWIEWVDAGRPTSGDLYERKKRMKKEVRCRINILQAIGERRRIQRIDKNFRDRHPRRFTKPKSSAPCSKLRVNNQSITEQTELLQVWENHFNSLSKSKFTDAAVMQDLQEGLVRMNCESRNNEDYIFDIDFGVEEVGKSIKNLPNRKAAGPDGISGEHLKFGGGLLITWITQLLNAILLLENVPPSFKAVNITPIYKGKGKDPLDPNNYRGIGVSNVFSKLFESLMLCRS